MVFFPPSRTDGCAPVAQLDRASDYESEGRVFESRRVHHFPSPSRHRTPKRPPLLPAFVSETVLVYTFA